VFNRSKPHLATRNATLKKLYELSKEKPVFIIPGNHDKSLVDAKLFSTFSPQLKIFNRPETVHVELNDVDFSISGIPFFRQAQQKFQQYLKRSKFEENTSFQILMLHQLIENSKHGLYDYAFTKNNK